MISNFYINHIFESNLELGWTIENPLDDVDNEIILQHSQSILNIESINEFIINIDTTDLIIEYRYSNDSTVWSSWSDINGIINNYTQLNIWFQIKITYTGSNSISIPEIQLLGTRKIDPIFEPSELLPGQPVIFTNQDTYKVFSLEDFEIFLGSGSIDDLEIKIRYTQTQGRHWSEWVPLNRENLQNLKIEKIKFCNFEFAFLNKSNQPINLFDLELIGEFQNITADYKTIARFGLKTQCNPITNPDGPCSGGDINACSNNCIPNSQAITPWNPDVDNCTSCVNDVQNLNDRNFWTGMISLQEKLNEYTNARNSWPVTYLLTDPDRKGIDHILHEQQIHNVIAMKDIKVIVPDNQFPTDNVMFSHLNFDLIQSFEVHILITHFKNLFGVEFRPSKRDVLYFCDLNQLWEVEQVFPQRGLMNASFYHRVLLKKYNNNKSRQYANTSDGQSANIFIDNLAKHTSLDQLFFGDNQNDIKQNTKDNNPAIPNPSQQYTQNTMKTIRKTIDAKVNIITDEIWNASLTVSDTQYELPIKSKGKKLIEYYPTDHTISIADNRAISMWFKSGDYNPTYDYTLLSNYDYTNNTGYKLSLFNGSLSFTWNQNTYNLPVAQHIQNDKWYVFMVNYNQVQSECEIAVYSRLSEDGRTLTSSKLVLVAKNKFNLNPESINHNESIFIGGTNTFDTIGNQNKWYLTNIRIYNQIINDRHIVLNENIVSDAHLTVLVDNAEKDLNLPDYGNL